MNMPQLPFHRYIGPVNPVDNGIPVDEDDRIAALHDIRYHQARIYVIVIERRLDYSPVIIGNWRSAIGALGLSAKYDFESVTGVHYPRSPSGPGSYGDHISNQYIDILNTGKRTSSILDTPPDTPPKKRQKMDNIEENQEGMQMDTTNTGTGGKTCGGSSTNTQAGSIHRPEGEFNNLPIGAGGKRFHVDVTPLGFRTPFITNSAGINSSLLVHRVYGHGLNNKYGGTNMEYTSTAADPMIITGTAKPNDAVYTNDL